MKIKTGLVLLLLIVLFSACNKIFFSGGEKQNLRPAKVFSNVTEQALDYTSLQLKCDGEFSWNSSKQSFQMQVRIKKDSIIWVSLRMMGIEGIRMQFTTDSLFMMDRLSNVWYGASYDQLNNSLDLDFDYAVFEAMLTNNFFFYPATTDTLRTIQEFNTCRDTAHYCISSIKQRKYRKLYSDTTNNRRYERKLSKEQERLHENQSLNQHNDFVIQTVKVYPDIYKISYVYIANFLFQQSLEIFYNKPCIFGDAYFPSEISLEYLSGDLEFTLFLKTEKMERNIEQKYPFKIPANYERIN
ncbi:MAG TPA: DUF4292 domain-containing protein [Bacteroidales bacterium]|nr:DUF4292 domain-containing protein [Bacteroidales bacterium]